MQHRPGVQLTALADLHVVVNHHLGVDGAAGADLHRRTDHAEGPHVAAHAHHGGGVHHGAGVDARGLGLARIQGIEGLGETQARIPQGDPGHACGAGLGLQGGSLLPLGRQQQSARLAGGQGGGQGVARFEKTELTRLGLIEGRGGLQLRVLPQIMG